jgi:pepF/M3 family oligoendopeptidase
MSVHEALPTWDLTPFFPEDDGRAFGDASERLTAELSRLEALFDHHGVRGGAGAAPDADAAARAVDEVLRESNRVHAQARLLNGYLHAEVTTDTTDDTAAGLQSRLATDLARLRVLTARFEAWVARVGADVLIARSEEAAAHDWPVRKAGISGRHRMSDAEEELAAELRLPGGTAWARLHRDLTGRLTASVSRPDGRTDELPMAAVRGLAADPDRAVRRAAWEAEQVAWESVSVPLAAAINGAKGEQAVLDRRRGWDDALAPALHHNAVDRATLDALTSAVRASLPDFRRYLRAKSRLLGGDGGLAWWDLLAPLPDGTTRAGEADGWTEATRRVRGAFATYAPALAGLVDRALEERWIDAGPRPGKVGGAYCMPVRDDESRVFLNFTGGADATQTLAHELGHAYHNVVLGERTWLQRQTPMALAETASIFCETIAVQSLLATSPAAARLSILDVDLQGATQVVVDIHSRFLFETELCRRRARGTLSVAELCELMLGAQEAAYGDGIDPATRHPWMWAVKGHYFTPFYNWPYTYGLLFGIGLFARFEHDPERFRAGYDDLLASTGMADAASLAQRFGIDVRDEAFWGSSLDVLRGRIDELVAAAPAEVGT